MLTAPLPAAGVIAASGRAVAAAALLAGVRVPPHGACPDASHLTIPDTFWVRL